MSSIVPMLAGKNGGPYFRSTITLQARMAEASDGSFLGLRGFASTADGQLSLTGIKAEEVNLKTVALNFVLDVTGDHISIPKGEIGAQRPRHIRGRRGPAEADASRDDARP